MSDSDEERAPGIDRQFRVVYPVIDRNGGTPTKEYVDNDRSAYKPEVIRDEGFEPWLADFIANKNDGIAGFDLDRIFRQPMDLERVIKAYCHAYFKEGRPKPVLWLPAMSIDLTDEDGRTIARMLVAIANQSSGKTVKRVTAFYADEAAKGKTYTNIAAFGWEMNDTLNSQAPIRKQMVLDAWAGMKCTTIAAELRAKGIKTARNKDWHGSNVRRVIAAPRNVGLVVYKGQLLYGEDGKPIRGDWEPLFTEDEEHIWHEAVARLPNREHKTRGTKTLLSNIAVCGKCGKGLIRIKRTETKFRYSCRSIDSGGCASVAITGNRLDAIIIELIQGLLGAEVVQEEAKPFANQVRLDRIIQLKREFMAAVSAEDLPMADAIREVKKLEAEERDLLGARREHTRKQHKITAIADEFPGLQLDKQRAVIKTFIKAIVIAPAGKPGVFDPNRITVVYED